MKESIHRYFQLGTIHLVSYPADRVDPLASLRALACDEYFDVVELCRFDDVETREQAVRILAPSHLEVRYSAHSRLLETGLSPNDLDEGGRQLAEDTLLDALDEAEGLGAKTVTFLAGRWEPAHREAAFSQLLKTTVNLCRRAGPRGMAVQLEVFDYDMDKAALIGPAPLAAVFAAAVRERCANFGLMVDLSHVPTTYETTRFVVQTLRPYITHLHFGNAVVTPGCEGYGDQHPRFGYPNSAHDTPELVAFLRVLREEGFFRPAAPLTLSAEIKPRPDEDCDVVLAATKRVLNRAWAML